MDGNPIGRSLAINSMDPAESTNPTLSSPADQRRIESICERFESALRSTQSTPLESFIDSAPDDLREALFVRLLLIEREIRSRQGMSFVRADYRQRFPQYQSAINRVFDIPIKPPASPGDTATVNHQRSLPDFQGINEWVGYDFGKLQPDGIRLFGRFQICKFLGKGAMGAVYRAHDPQLDRDVALKIPLPGSLHTEKSIKRFLNDARHAAQLRHPNIVPVHDAGQIDSTFYIASAFIKGKTLREVMDQKTLPSLSTGEGSGVRVQFPVQEAVTLVSKLAAALYYSHQQGIIHRDIKPENIMVDDTGEPHILDFGLARRNDGEEHLTRDGVQMGTAAYMSPEQARGESNLADARSDLWSLGVVLYELLTGQRPFRGATFQAYALDILEHEPIPPRKLNSRISKDLDTICQKCLTKERSGRYENCGVLADELGRSLRGEPIKARRITPVERTWRWAKRHPALALTNAALLLLLLALAVGGPLAAWRQSYLKQQADQLAIEKGDLLTEKTKALDEKTQAVANLIKANRAEREALLNHLFERGCSAQASGNGRQAIACYAGVLSRAPENHPLRRSALNFLAAAEKHEPKILMHSTDVLSVAFSPTGDRVLTGSDDNTARLWDARTGKPLGEPMRHEERVTSVAFSPTGDRVLTGSWDQTARVWNAETGKPLGEPMRHESIVTSVAFSPAGDRVLTGSWDSTARLWDAQTRKPLGEIMRHENKVECVAFSPTGDRVLTGSDDNTARLWDAHTGKPLGEPMRHTSTVACVAFSPTGDRVLTGSNDMITQLWDAQTGTPLGSPMSNGGSLHSVAFSPNGDRMLTGTHNSTALLWDTKTGRPIGDSMRHEAYVRCAVFSSTGDRVLTGSWDSTARIWDAWTGKPLGAPMRHEGPVEAVAFSPAGNYVLTGSYDNAARLWDTHTGMRFAELISYESYGQHVCAIAFSPTGDRFVTGSVDKSARLWDVQNGKPLGEPMWHEDQVRAVAFSPTGDRVLTGSWDGTARLWDAQTGKPLMDPLRHNKKHWVNSVAFSPSGDRLLTGSSDGIVRLWHAHTGKPLGNPIRHEKGVTSVAFSPTGDRILTGSLDKTARLWDAQTGKPLGKPLPHESDVWSVAFSPRGDRVLTGSHDQTARLWDAQTGKPLGEPMRLEGRVNCVVFSPTGDLALTGSWDKTARLWDAQTGKQVGKPMLPNNDVACVAFSPTGDRVLTSSWGNVRLWEIPRLPSEDMAFLALWARIRSGYLVNDEGQLRALSQEEWLQAWADFEKVGADYLAEEKRRWEERHSSTPPDAAQ